MKRNKDKIFTEYFGLVLQGDPEDFERLKNHIITETQLKIKYIKSSRHYLLIQPVPIPSPYFRGEESR